MTRIWYFLLEHTRFSYILLFTFLILGVFALQALPKESSPEVEVPVGIITTVLPGASAEDTEQLVTNPLEDEIEGLANVSNISSTSGEGISTIIVEFDTKAPLDESIDNLRREVERAQSSLPDAAEEPFISEIDFVNQPIMIVTLSANLPARSFVDISDTVRSEILALPGVNRVEVSGLQKREVQVVVRRDELLHHGLSINTVIQALAQANLALPVGSVEASGNTYNVSLESLLEDPTDVASLSLPSSNGPIFLRDIATIVDGVERETSITRLSVEGEPSERAVSLSVFKRAGEDVTEVSSLVKEKLQELQEGSEIEDVEVLVSFDMGDYIKKDLGNLSVSGLQTVALVILVLLLTIGWKEALIAGAAVPLSFLIAFIGLYFSGNTINFVSLFALILAVGVLVDSAIVITEGIHSELKKGKTGSEAAHRTIKEFGMPLLSGTLTTIAVFVPLFFLSGVTGEFIASIPFTIIFVLLASLIVALGFVPLISSLSLSGNITPLQNKQEEYANRVGNWYLFHLSKILDSRKHKKRFLIGLVVAFVVTMTFPGIGIVKSIFFPQEDIDFIFVDIELEQGTTLEETNRMVLEIEQYLYDKEDIDSFITSVGSGSQFGTGGSGSHMANITLNLDPKRRKTSSEIAQELNEELTQNVRGPEIRVQQPNNGPPVGSPILVKLHGENLGELRSAAEVAEGVLEKVEGTVNVRSSGDTVRTGLSLTIDLAKATRAGISIPEIAATLRSALFGTTATTIKRLGEDIDINVLLALEGSELLDPYEVNNIDPDTILQLQIPTQNGPVLLGTIANLELEGVTSRIEHEDGERTAEVTSDLLPGYVPASIIKEFENRMEEVTLPSGITVDFGGETEETEAAFQEMMFAFVGGMLLMLIILILQFNSFRYTLFILLTIPLSLTGIMIGLALTGQALSFPSLMGVIALAGIVVNNAIILIDKMNGLREENPGKSIRDVVLEASGSRLRPIILTTLTTVIGVVPLTYASALWAPLAWSIIFGLSFAFILTLVLIPILYLKWHKK